MAGLLSWSEANLGTRPVVVVARSRLARVTTSSWPRRQLLGGRAGGSATVTAQCDRRQDPATGLFLDVGESVLPQLARWLLFGRAARRESPRRSRLLCRSVERNVWENTLGDHLPLRGFALWFSRAGLWLRTDSQGFFLLPPSSVGHDHFILHLLPFQVLFVMPEAGEVTQRIKENSSKGS